MLFIQVAVALAIIVVTVFVSVKKNGAYRYSVRIPVAILGSFAAMIWMFVIAPSFGQVPTGHRGVVLRFGGATGEVLNEGFYFVTPFVSTVQLMNVQTNTYEAKSVDAASKDLQTVHTTIVVNYSLDPMRVVDVYRTLGLDYVNRIMAPAVEEVAKANTSRFEAEKLITQRTEAKSNIDRDLESRLEPYGIRIHAVSITNFAFSKEFEQSIEAKVVAEQQALKAVNDLTRIETEAKQKIATAQAEAESIRIRGEALRNNPDLVQLTQAEAFRDKWDGKLPQYMMSSNSGSLIQLPASSAR